jgi:nanoRNase/pAp phosphatase (c-di-AMP/oligoRNAs hydrolase)
MLFRTRPVASLKLWGAALHGMSMQDDVIWTTITLDMLREQDATMEDGEGLVDFLLATRETRVAIVLKEAAPGETKVSMRTIPGVDATRIVGPFGGGGHQRAAGCTMSRAYGGSRDNGGSATRELSIRQQSVCSPSHWAEQHERPRAQPGIASSIRVTSSSGPPQTRTTQPGGP